MVSTHKLVLITPWISWLLLFLLPQSNFAQESKGTLQISVSPPYAWVRVDTFVVSMQGKKQPFSLTLPAGPHEVEVWTSGFLLQKETVNVPNGGTASFKKGLRKLDPEFQAYRNAKQRYTLRKATRIGQGVLFLGCTGLSWAIALDNSNKVDTYRDMALAFKERYAVAVSQSEIDANRAAFEEYQQLHLDEQKKVNRQRYLGLPIAALLTGATTWYIIHTRNHPLKKPRYDAKNPFVYQPVLQFDPVSNSSHVGFICQF